MKYNNELINKSALARKIGISRAAFEQKINGYWFNEFKQEELIKMKSTFLEMFENIFEDFPLFVLLEEYGINLEKIDVTEYIIKSFPKCLFSPSEDCFVLTLENSKIDFHITANLINGNITNLKSEFFHNFKFNTGGKIYETNCVFDFAKVEKAIINYFIDN